MRLAIIGCGYVADLYAKTLDNYAELELAGVYDYNAANAEVFCRRWRTRSYAELRALLSDASIALVLNLTNPRSHYDITRQCLIAGKHVYSEKPLAMESKSAQELVALAREKNLYLASAPCSMLSETAQTVYKALRDGIVGRVRLIYATFDDGMIAPHLQPWTWTNEAGVPWPAKDEFEIGCTYEHAGYMLTWLAQFFGPAQRVHGFATCLLPDKGIEVGEMAPDFTVGCIEYADGVVARVTCGLIAPKDKSMTIVGTEGVLTVADIRDDRSPVTFSSIPSKGMRKAIETKVNSCRRLLRWPGWQTDWRWSRELPLVAISNGKLVDKRKPVDFCHGPAEMVRSIRGARPCRLSAELAAHIVELIEHLQYPERFDAREPLISSFPRIVPLSG